MAIRNLLNGIARRIGVTLKKTKINSFQNIVMEEQTSQSAYLPAKLFVGQIPKQMSKEELEQLFTYYGYTVLDSSVLVDLKTGFSRGCGFVTLASREEAERAIGTLHNSAILPPAKNPIQVDFADGELEKLDHKLFVGMIPRGTTEDDLWDVFSQYGEIESLNIINNPNKSSDKVCAFVKYKTREESFAAIDALNAIHKINDSTLVVKFADNKRQQIKRKLLHVAIDEVAHSLLKKHKEIETLKTNGILNVPKGPDNANLYIENLPLYWGNETLKAVFLSFGNVLSANVFIDKQTGLSKGFGFVSFEDEESAMKAIAAMDGFVTENKKLTVKIKK